MVIPAHVAPADAWHFFYGHQEKMDLLLAAYGGRVYGMCGGLAPPSYQLYSGLLFGLPLAVTSFNRLSRLLESLCRRLVVEF